MWITRKRYSGSQCRRGGSCYKLRGPGRLEGGLGPDLHCMCFVFIGSIIICRLYKITLSHQAQATLYLKARLSDLRLRFLAGPPFLGRGGGGGERKNLYTGPRKPYWRPWWYYVVASKCSRNRFISEKYRTAQ
jgi:hypothetical protein